MLLLFYRYSKAVRHFAKFRRLVANKSKPTLEDKQKLKSKKTELQNMRIKLMLKRNVTVSVSSEHFYMTGIMCDVTQVRPSSNHVVYKFIGFDLSH